jgi:hypothetical protein
MNHFQLASTDYPSYRPLQEILSPIIQNAKITKDTEWIHLWKQELSKNSTWNVVQWVLQVYSLKDFLSILKSCSNVTQALELKLTKDQKRILYCTKTPNSIITTTIDVNDKIHDIPPTQNLDNVPTTIPDNVSSNINVNHTDNTDESKTNQLSTTTATIEESHMPDITTPSTHSNTKPDQSLHTNNALYQDLLLDIEEEEVTENSTYKNRFLHHFIYSYNAKMRDLGNYVKTATESISSTVKRLEDNLTTKFQSIIQETKHINKTITVLKNDLTQINNHFD